MPLPASTADRKRLHTRRIDRCHALETRSDTVRRYYPKWYRGAA